MELELARMITCQAALNTMGNHQEQKFTKSQTVDTGIYAHSQRYFPSDLQAKRLIICWIEDTDVVIFRGL